MAERQNRTREDQYMLRLPDGMRDMLKQSAKTNGRSINAEIIHRIETWRNPSVSSLGAARICVDTSEVEGALAIVTQLGEAAESVAEACAKLGIKIGGASLAERSK